MNLQSIVVMVMVLYVCPSDLLNLTIQFQKFEGPELYIFKEGRGYLNCFADYAGDDLELQWFFDGQKITEAKQNGKYLEIFIRASEFQQRTFTCKGKVQGGGRAEASATVTVVGDHRKDVVILSSHKSTVIKDDTRPITITCRTGVPLSDIFLNPIQLSHNYNVLYRNGVRQRGASMYDIAFVGFSGFAFNNIYTAVTFNGGLCSMCKDGDYIYTDSEYYFTWGDNCSSFTDGDYLCKRGDVSFEDPRQLVGTVKCSRKGVDEQTITFTDREDITRMDMSLLKDGREIGSITWESEPIQTVSKTLHLLPSGNYLITCTITGGYPEPFLNLFKNGVPVTTQNYGNRYQAAAVNLTETDDELECNAKVDIFSKHVLKFNFNVSEVMYEDIFIQWSNLRTPKYHAENKHDTHIGRSFSRQIDIGDKDCLLKLRGFYNFLAK